MHTKEEKTMMNNYSTLYIVPNILYIRLGNGINADITVYGIKV